MFRIGEFARLTRASVKMLRHYDRIGLLRPARTDPTSGYRYYAADQLVPLNRVLLLRDLGFGLAEIAGMLAGQPDADLAYRRQERSLAASIARSRAQLRALRARRSMLGDGPPPADVVLRPVARELVATLSGGPGDDVGDLFYRLEARVRDLGARSPRPPLTLRRDAAGAVTVAVPLTHAVPAGEGIGVGWLEGARSMACSVHLGGYDGLRARVPQVLRWLRSTGLRPAGRAREVYLRFDAEPELALPVAYLTSARSQFVTELQIPVEPALSCSLP